MIVTRILLPIVPGKLHLHTSGKLISCGLDSQPSGARLCSVEWVRSSVRLSVWKSPEAPFTHAGLGSLLAQA